MKPLLLPALLFATVLSAGLTGCSTEVAPATAAAPAAPPATPLVPPTPECLSTADLADGATDQVVHKCANCALHMDGDAEYTSTHAGYTFHSCSPGCKSSLDKDPGKVLARACK